MYTYYVCVPMYYLSGYFFSQAAHFLLKNAPNKCVVNEKKQYSGLMTVNVFSKRHNCAVVVGQSMYTIQFQFWSKGSKGLKLVWPLVQARVLLLVRKLVEGYNLVLAHECRIGLWYMAHFKCTCGRVLGYWCQDILPSGFWCISSVRGAEGSRLVIVDEARGVPRLLSAWC